MDDERHQEDGQRRGGRPINKTMARTREYLTHDEAEKLIDAAWRAVQEQKEL